MDSEELRNLYANLLAKAMNSDTKDFVHPSYLEVIKQFSPIDAQIFKELGSHPLFPYISLAVHEHLDKDSFSAKEIAQQRVVVHYITPITFTDIDSVNFSLSNIERLGLIEYQPGTKEHPNYEDLFKMPNYLESKSYLQNIANDENKKDNLNKTKWEYKEYYNFINLTEFGRKFFKICILDL